MKLPEPNRSALVRAQIEEARFAAQTELVGPKIFPYEVSTIQVAIHWSRD